MRISDKVLLLSRSREWISDPLKRKGAVAKAAAPLSEFCR
jgi:hypothetical protein